ncbi:hypothetical protein PROFUN_08703 [Planoprotostelium fungivorum]|uniref:Uncharacterized protein n=1 Tax=Planoprotostelium fungivorum TaxID=1890364 RepID=A0A2P6MQU4_9EUKA|nr:hypothetical protein PROFUN_08703 [Planoprotostelium fungivorum]
MASMGDSSRDLGMNMEGLTITSSLKQSTTDRVFQLWLNFGAYDPNHLGNSNLIERKLVVPYVTLIAGHIAAADFRQALKENNVPFGTPEGDHIMSLVTVNSDGRVDYRRLSVYVDNLMAREAIGLGFKSGTQRGTSIELSQDRYQESLYGISEQQEYAKDVSITVLLYSYVNIQLVVLNRTKIQERFQMYEKGEISMKGFMEFIRYDIGIPINRAVTKVLRRKEEFGSCSYSALISALCLTPEQEEAYSENLIGTRLNHELAKADAPDLISVEHFVNISDLEVYSVLHKKDPGARDR